MNEPKTEPKTEDQDDPVGDGLTPEEWDEHEREQDRLQREHDRMLDERYA
jgi:hypothetical protein